MLHPPANIIANLEHLVFLLFEVNQEVSTSKIFTAFTQNPTWKEMNVPLKNQLFHFYTESKKQKTKNIRLRLNLDLSLTEYISSEESVQVLHLF